MDLAAGLDISVVAEGIEDVDQLGSLTAMGCRYGQGYLFSPPLSAASIAEIIASGGVLRPRSSSGNV